MRNPLWPDRNPSLRRTTARSSGYRRGSCVEEHAGEFATMQTSSLPPSLPTLAWCVPVCVCPCVCVGAHVLFLCLNEDFTKATHFANKKNKTKNELLLLRFVQTLKFNTGFGWKQSLVRVRFGQGISGLLRYFVMMTLWRMAEGNKGHVVK